GTTGPLKGATVQIDGTIANYTLKTDAKGNYEYWIDNSDNPLTSIAALDGWQPQTDRTNIKAQHTVTANFTLKPDAC
ncbi:MAG: hypothetical protein JWM19_2343, partial [Actinomycetia bacterium]|nr:hypothetical protein [Actinomycetes bacterium]